MGEGGNEDGEGLHAGELIKYANILEVVEARLPAVTEGSYKYRKRKKLE